MHENSNNFSVLYVLKKQQHRHHINVTKTPPRLLFLASYPSYTKASFHSKIASTRINLKAYVNQAEKRDVKNIQLTYKCKIL